MKEGKRDQIAAPRSPHLELINADFHELTGTKSLEDKDMGVPNSREYNYHASSAPLRILLIRK